MISKANNGTEVPSYNATFVVVFLFPMFHFHYIAYLSFLSVPLFIQFPSLGSLPFHSTPRLSIREATSPPPIHLPAISMGSHKQQRGLCHVDCFSSLFPVPRWRLDIVILRLAEDGEWELAGRGDTSLVWFGFR
jgi:hypothetical protein